MVVSRKFPPPRKRARRGPGIAVNNTPLQWNVKGQGHQV